VIQPDGNVAVVQVIATTTTSDWLAAVVVLAPVVAALGGIWIKGRLDRKAEHRSARRSAYAEFIAASRIVAARSYRYRADRTFRAVMASSIQDLAPFVFGLAILGAKMLQRFTEAERVGLLGRMSPSSLSTNSTSESQLYDALEDLLRTNSALRIVGSDSIIAAADDVLSVSQRIVATADRGSGFTMSRSISEFQELKGEFDEAHNRLISVARKEFPGL
jgi:hypothetical protein